MTLVMETRHQRYRLLLPRLMCPYEWRNYVKSPIFIVGNNTCSCAGAQGGKLRTTRAASGARWLRSRERATNITGNNRWRGTISEQA